MYHTASLISSQLLGKAVRLARFDRLDRVAQPVATPVAPPARKPPVTVEIKEAQPDDTKIEVIACNGQVVIVTREQVIEAQVMFERANGNHPTIERIQRVVCRAFGVTRVDLISARRTLALSWPRQIAMYLAKTLTPRSLPEIGRRFGGRDHTTVLHAVRKVEERIAADPSLRATIDQLKAELGCEVL